MKVAVTGATGFIGRHIIEELKARSIETIAVVRPGSENYKAVESDVTVFMDLHNVPSNAFELIGKPDILIHLAWSGLPNYKSLHHFETELPTQYKFLKNMIVGGLKSLVVTGTCFEYGMRSGCLNEEIDPQPENTYGFAKNALRKQLEFCQVVHPFSLTWARLFYIYGEGQSENSLLSQLKSAIDRGESVFNMSGGEQLRDYLSVKDVSTYLVNLALEKVNIGIINVCSGEPISIRKLVEKWVEINGSSIRLNLGYYPYPDYEPMAFWGDTTKLYKYIGENI